MKQIVISTAMAVCLAAPVWAEGQAHFVAIHVDENDPQVMNMALNNVANLSRYYMQQGDTVTVEIVAYGPGLKMFVDGQSPVADRISAMALELDNIRFAACGNTHRNMSQKAGKEIALLDEAYLVPSGVVRLIELQEQDYSYIRP
jgi:intracellular sulfur oxidation DsrE/DsrF family protein